jgi:hypothetical protein
MKSYQIKQKLLFMAIFTNYIIFIFTFNINAIDLFISSTKGNDANPGTIDAPLKTLYKARDIVRTFPKTGPINIWLREGTYYLDSALILGIQDGGTANAPIKYSNYCGEKVIISGGKRITSAWSNYSGNIMVNNIGPNLKFDQLFINGVRQILARYPNYNENTIILNGYAADCIGATRVARWKNPAEGPGYVRGLHSIEWGGWSLIITGKNSDNTVSTRWVGDNNRDDQPNVGLHPTYRMVENIFEELDAEGEWYYQKSTGNLFFWPKAGTNLNTAIIEIASLEELIKIIGTSSTSPVRYISFNGITFTHTHRTLFTRNYERLLRGDWCIVRAGAVFIQNAENVEIKNCVFDQIGGNGIFINGYNKNHLIYNNNFVDAGASCVAVVGLTSAVRDPSFWPNDHHTTIADLTPGPLTQDYPRECIIANNSMINLGRFEKQTAGVHISIAENIIVRHNTINGSPRAGININDGTFGGHIIEYNDIFNCVRETGDHGPFNSWGRDRYWSLGGYNPNGVNGTAKRPYCLLDARTTTHIRNNRIEDNNGRGNFGIDLDDGSTNYWIYNNLTINCGIKLRDGFYRKVYNNIIISDQFHCHVWYAECRDTIRRNIVVSPNPYEFIGINLSANQALLDYNLFYNPTGRVNYTPSAGQETHSVFNSDPMFTNTATRDYRVRAGSPALSLGFVNFPMDSFGRVNLTITPECPQVSTTPNFHISSIHTGLKCFVNKQGLKLQYWLEKDAKISIALYTIKGEKIIIVPSNIQKAGKHEIIWMNNKNHFTPLSSQYLAVLDVNGKKHILKIVYLN